MDLTKIGYAYSADGITWNRLPQDESPYHKEGLVLLPEDETREGVSGVLSDPSVVKVDGTYYMWYNSFGFEIARMQS